MWPSARPERYYDRHRGLDSRESLWDTGTLLGNLGRRAAAARTGGLPDPVAIEIVDRLDYDFEGLSPADPTLVTAQCLLPYFQRDQVHGLIAGIATRLPGSLLVFDVAPEAMLDMVRRGSGRERDLAVELWTWLFNPRERATISAIPGVEELRDLPPPLKRDLASMAIAAIGRLQRRLRYSLPVFQVLQARFRAVSAH